MKPWTRAVQLCFSTCRCASIAAGTHRPIALVRNSSHGQLLSSSATSKRTAASAAKPKVQQVEINQLPQGMIPLEPAPKDVPAGVSVIQQAMNNMRKFEHCVLLTRVGNFYELYDKQALEYGPLLNLKVASKRTTERPVAMAGFPFFQLDRYLKMLVQEHGKFVAISEEIKIEQPDGSEWSRPRIERQVRRVITPGTLIDEHFLSPFEHNYLLCIRFGEHLGKEDASPMHSQPTVEQTQIGLAWLDLSSGDFFTQSTSLALLSSVVARIQPREIVLHNAVPSNDSMSSEISSMLNGDSHLVTYFEPDSDILSEEDWSNTLEQSVSNIESFTQEENQSASLLVQYVKKQLPGLKFKLQAPIRRQSDEYMSIDKNTLRGLEITQTMRDGAYKGSLLQVIRRTVTESGARLMSHRLTSPSMSLSVINDRLDLVQVLVDDEVFLEESIKLLRQSHDTLRLVQKFSFGRGDADDLLRLSKTIDITKNIGKLLEDFHTKFEQTSIAALLARFEWQGPDSLAKRILDAIDQEGLLMQQRSEEASAAAVAGMAREILEHHSATDEMSALNHRLNAKRFTSKLADASAEEGEKSADDEIWTMRRMASPILDKLHKSLEDLLQDKASLAKRLREQLKAQSLTLKVTPGLGHICHVRGKDMKANIADLGEVRTVGSSKSTMSFYLPEWTKLGNQIEVSKQRIRQQEQEIFQSLREHVVQNLVVLRRNAAVLDDLDVACSFARLAREHGLTRPRLNHSCEHKIWGGRHMTVENGLTATGGMFVPNDCRLEANERIWLITGPNMAGKSTFLRQTALISILAQTGSFVPAEHAEIGLVDSIFSRIGSADNLSQNQSTFMVEMLEATHILRNATERSFVVMDEVGRGTTPEDGIAIGYALLHRLMHVTKCRTLFATHFHALADMTKDFPQLACYCTNVVEESDGTFRYDHVLRKGVNKESHALKVAQLAGMPDETVQLAAQVLKSLQVRHV